jgi:hypothetical protein
VSHNADSAARELFIAGLRELADFLDRNPRVPAPCRADVFVFPADAEDTEMFAEVDSIARLIGMTAGADGSPCGHYRAIRDFGPIQYRAVAIPQANRDNRERGE